MSIFLILDRGTLTHNTRDLELLGAEKFGGGKETHLKLLIFIKFEEFFEGLFEDGVAEGVCHDVKAAGHLKAGLHLDDTDLVKG